MKTKNKMIAMVEIAIVLCSVFLVAIPAIAAQEQNQEMQKVSATASEVTTASEDDFVLGIYGNANEDETIDMGDVVYTKLAIFGKKPKTKLCDAKYDGRINVLDVIQTKLIILGKEKEITIVDSVDRIVTVKKPVKSIVAPSGTVVEMVRSLGAKDRLIGVSKYIKLNTIFFPELSKLPSVGSSMTPDCEVLLNLHPGVVFLTYSGRCDPIQDTLEAAGITVVRFSGLPRPTEANYVQEMEKLGYILDKKKEAEEFIDWYGSFMDKIKDRVSGLSDDEKPRMYFELWFGDYSACAGGSCDQSIMIAGGNNIFSGSPGAGGIYTVDPEEVINRNPEIIVRGISGGWELGPITGYDVDDLTGMKAKREEIMNRPELANVIAVKKERVYLISAILFGNHGGPSHFFIGIAYMAKWFHPELSEDFDPQAIHQEYLTKFQRLDYDMDKHGVFVYPAPS